MIKAGAGGNWKRFDEKFDETIVKQTDLSCVSAVGEMLLRERGIHVSQEEIRDIIVVPSYFEALARCLNQFDISDDGKIWRGFSTDEKSLLSLLKEQSLGVVLVEPTFLGHAVFVVRNTKTALFQIKDSFDQTTYKMTVNDFFAHWGGAIIARKYEY
ncbi:hypothetical protein BH20ACI1_BH20ACI1_00160 [soil metagenome]